MIKSYITCCIGGVIFLSFARFLAPRGKNGDAVRSVISVITVAIIVIPAVTFLKNGANKSGPNNNAYLDYERKIAEKTDVNSVKIALRLNGVECEKITVEFGDENKIKSITVFFEKSVIDGGDESINIIEKVKSTVAETLGIDKSAVIIETQSEGGADIERTG